jgi:hypothetical protein
VQPLDEGGNAGVVVITAISQMHIHEAVLASTSFSLSGSERISIGKASGRERARRGRNERECRRESHGRCDRDIRSLIATSATPCRILFDLPFPERFLEH